MKNNVFRMILLVLAIVMTVSCFVACDDDTSNDNDFDTTYKTSAEKTLAERKKIAEQAVAEYICDYMKKWANTGKYSVIDYSKMRYSATSTASGNVFTVKIDIYHYNSFGQRVGKNKFEIKASAEVDKYGIVSSVEALSFIPIAWDL